MIDLRYKTIGDPKNKPLLLLHGFMGESSDWDILAEKLNDTFYCIAIDLPGHGKTTSTDVTEYTIEKTAESIIQLLQKQNITQSNILGYSMGGRIAFYLITTYPDLFSKAVIESSSPGLKTIEEKKMRVQKDSYITKRMRMQPFEMFLQDWYKLDLFSTIDKNSDAYKNMIQKKTHNNIDQLALSLKYAGTGTMTSLWDELDKIKTNLLLITGNLDRKYTEIAHEICSRDTKFSHQIIDDVSHNVHFESIDKYFEVVKNFLTEK